MGACCTTIDYSSVGIKERWGDYDGILDPGMPLSQLLVWSHAIGGGGEMESSMKQPSSVKMRDGVKKI